MTMKTLKKIAALTIVAGGFMVAGMTSSADAGCYGGYCAPTYGYGYGYARPLVVSYPSVNLHCDIYGCNYFLDSYGIRHDCYQTSFANRYFYLDHGVRRFVLGY